jgi:hypothetical protein
LLTKITVNYLDKKATCHTGGLRLLITRAQHATPLGAEPINILVLLIQPTILVRSNLPQQKPIWPPHNNTRERPISEKYWLAQHTNPTTTHKPLSIKPLPGKS